VKIALVAIGGTPATARPGLVQRAGLAAGMAANRITAVSYQAARAGASIHGQRSERIFEIKLWTPGPSRLGALLSGQLAGVHLRFIEKPDFALVLNPWNAPGIARMPKPASGTAVVVDALVRPSLRSDFWVGMLGRLLATRAKRQPSSYVLLTHSTAAAEAFEKRFGVLPRTVAAGLNAPLTANARPKLISSDPLLADGFDLLVGSADNQAADSAALRAHARGAKDTPLIYLPSVDVRVTNDESLDDSIAKHPRLRILLAAGDPNLVSWLLLNARLVIGCDSAALVDSQVAGVSVLLTPQELLLVDSPANRELFSEATWLWTGEAALANLLTDKPWQSARGKLRLRGLQPLTDWQAVANEYLGAIES